MLAWRARRVTPNNRLVKGSRPSTKPPVTLCAAADAQSAALRARDWLSAARQALPAKRERPLARLLGNLARRTTRALAAL